MQPSDTRVFRRRRRRRRRHTVGVRDHLSMKKKYRVSLYIIERWMDDGPDGWGDASTTSNRPVVNRPYVLRLEPRDRGGRVDHQIIRSSDHL